METRERTLEEMRGCFHDVFFGTPHGKEVLTAILQSLGWWERDARNINPSEIAFANKLLYMCKVFDDEGATMLTEIGRLA